MSGIVYYSSLLFLGFWEVWMAYYWMESILFVKDRKTNKYKIIKWINILVLGNLLTINRSIVFFSWFMVAFCILITTIFVRGIVEGKMRTIWGIIAFYYTFLTLLDFIFTYICVEFIGIRIENIIYVKVYSIWTIAICFLARLLLQIILYILKKMFAKDMQEFVFDYDCIFFVGSIFLFIIMIRYLFVLNAMVSGEQKIQGADGAFLLAVILTILILGIVFFWRYEVKKQEAEGLKLHDRMLEERCQEMQQTRQVVHDLKNHIIVLKKYSDEGREKELNKYIQDLYHELTIYGTQEWTGIEILDYLLTQKVKMAQWKQIEIQIETQRIDSLLFSNIEIVAVFGNLLDNAIEACEKLDIGERWIYLLIKKKNHMLFLEVVNSKEHGTDERSKKNTGRKKKGGIHGYGLKSVCQIVERHKGQITCESTEGKYSVSIMVYGSNKGGKLNGKEYGF